METAIIRRLLLLMFAPMAGLGVVAVLATLPSDVPWYEYLPITASIVVLIVWPALGVFLALGFARERGRKKLVIVVLTTAVVYFVGLLIAANLWNYTHHNGKWGHGPSHAPGSTTSVPASHSP
jgi:uncharacterized membrane protein YqaE (UPF0057 family)